MTTTTATKTTKAATRAAHRMRSEVDGPESEEEEEESVFLPLPPLTPGGTESVPYRTIELKPADRDKKLILRFSEYHFEKYLTFAQPSGAVLAAGVGV